MTLTTQDSGIQNPNGQGNLSLANPNANMGALNPTAQPQQPTPTPVTPAPVVPTAPTAPTLGANGQANSGTAYTIKSGDTLSQIAQAQGTTVAQLMSLNPNITDPNKIQAGANLNTKYKSALQQAQGSNAPV